MDITSGNTLHYQACRTGRSVELRARSFLGESLRWSGLVKDRVNVHNAYLQITTRWGSSACVLLVAVGDRIPEVVAEPVLRPWMCAVFYMGIIQATTESRLINCGMFSATCSSSLGSDSYPDILSSPSAAREKLGLGIVTMRIVFRMTYSAHSVGDDPRTRGHPFRIGYDLELSVPAKSELAFFSGCYPKYRERCLARLSQNSDMEFTFFGGSPRPRVSCANGVQTVRLSPYSVFSLPGGTRNSLVTDAGRSGALLRRKFDVLVLTNDILGPDIWLCCLLARLMRARCASGTGDIPPNQQPRNACATY